MVDSDIADVSGPIVPVAAYAGLTPALFERLCSHLAESVAVIDGEGRVRSVLGPPGGAAGIGDVVGRHIFEYLVPEDLPRALELAVEALGSSPGWEALWNAPIRDGNGAVKDFEVKILNCQDDPDVGGFVVRLRELPRRAELSSPLFAGELGRELETLAGTMPLPILLVGSDRRIYYANDAARAMCGTRIEELFRSGLGVLATDEHRELVDGAVQELLAGPGEQTIVFQAKDNFAGQAKMLEARVSALGKGTHVLALVVTLVDVTARHLTESELRRRATSDPLTGLLNRSEIEESLRLALCSPARRVGVCYVDLDAFKSVNDTHGHEVGDEFLVAVAQALSGELALTDRVGRFGGDEFVIAAEVADSSELHALATRVTNAVALCARARGFSVTASIGTSLDLPGDTPRDLVRRADRAMYEEKRLRRVKSPT